MERVIFTCPFTGVEFQAFKEPHSKRMFFAHALDHEMFGITWDMERDCFIVPAHMFRHIPTCTPAEAAEILDVSRQRISQLVNDDVIPSHIVNGQPVFVMSDVLNYKESRKAGRPRKDGND